SIVQDSYDITADAAHSLQPPYSGSVNHKEQDTYGNSSFKENQSLRLEFDSDKGTLVLFIDDVQQPVYISGIKRKCDSSSVCIMLARLASSDL
ncbi:MAG: hypothetical protein EZS28_037515, partial [Streblomastix strix]